MHYLRMFFNALPSVAGILLATLAFALVFVKELDEKLKDKRKLRWSVAIVLSLIGASAFISDLVQRAQERTNAQIADNERRKSEQEQKQAVESIKEQLHQSELQRVADVKYMQGKLNVFVQFAPAIVRLAQATEENTRRQYEAKMLNNKDLYDTTMDVVRRLRDFAAKYNLQSRQEMDTQWASARKATSDAERQKLFDEEIRSSTMHYYQKETEFRSSILPDAIYVRNELLRRKLPEPVSTNPLLPAQFVQMVFMGHLSGPYPELDAADYLEQMAKQLRLK